MIDLTKDMFVHLSLSAKALKEERAQEPVVSRAPKLSKLEITNYDVVKPIKVASTKTIQQSIEEVVDNPKVRELKKELAAAEEIFESLKESGENIDFIDRIENKIEQLKKMVDEKTYY